MNSALRFLTPEMLSNAKVSVKNPSNVIAGFEESVGGTFFHLNDMQVGREGLKSIRFNPPVDMPPNLKL